jgi:hypothetical protein
MMQIKFEKEPAFYFGTGFIWVAADLLGNAYGGAALIMPIRV